MASPQKENGFTSIANEILDEISKRKFNGTQFRIIMIVWRYTYGFQRKSHEFSLNFLTEKTGMSRDSVKRELKGLVNKSILTVVKEASFNNARQLAFNKNYEQWKVETNEQMTQGDKNNTGGENDTSTGGESSPSTGGENDTSTGGGFAPYINKEKESNKESNKESRKSRTYDVDSIHHQLALRLYERILENNPDHKKPNIQKWANDVRLTMEQDKRTPEQIEYLIDWTQQDPFWKGNILSISKLREQFDRLVIQVKEKMNQQNKRDGPKKSRAYQSMEEFLEEEEPLSL